MLNPLGQIGSASSNNNNLNASNIPLPPGSPPSTPNYDTDMQQHQQQQLQQQPQVPLQYYRPQPAFGGVKEPITFASLAKKTDNVVGETLSQYGPVMPTIVGSPIPTIGQQNMSAYPTSITGLPTTYNPHQGQVQYNHFTQNPIISRANSSILTSSPPVYNIQSHISNASFMSSSSQAGNTQHTSYGGPTSSSTSYQHPTAVVIGRPSTISVLNHVPTSSSSNNLIANTSQSSSQPVTSISPPLDPLRAQHDGTANDDQSSEEIQSFNILDDVKKRCVNMVLNQVLEEHRHLKFKLLEFQQKRQHLETEIHDMRRNLPGHGNLDTHPKFIRLKEKEKDCDGKCRQYNEAIKYVADILSTKWQHSVPQDVSVQQPLQKIKKNPPLSRAKMSTATPPTKTVKDQPEDSSMLLNLTDGKTWCKVCDHHCDTFKEYLVHLHSRDHERNVGQARTPWRKTSDPLPHMTLTRTYNKIKSICAQVSSELKQNFRVQDLDEILNPNLKNGERLKNLNLERERGKFDPENDRLLQLKGYDQIVPIKGYYCKLCDLVMCDVREGEEHERSPQHNREYAKFVALSDLSEKKFLLDLDKSLKARDDANREREPVANSRVDRTKEASSSKIREQFMPHVGHPVVTPAIRAVKVANEVSQFSARLPYKKPTSRIVDDHDVIADLFEKRDEEKRRVAKNDIEKQAVNERDNQRQDGQKQDGQKSVERSSRDPVAETNKRTRSPHEPTLSRSEKPASKRKIPEIVPIKKSSSGALKKLRRESKIYDEDLSQKDDELVIVSVKKPLHALAERDNTVLLSSSDNDDDAPLPKRRVTEPDNFESISSSRCIEEGDPNSLFPHLELCVNGNTHRDALRDKRLIQRTRVVMNRINLEDYKDILLPPDSLDSRISFLITKKEKLGDDDKTDEVKLPLPTILDPETGKNVPVDPEDDDRESRSSDDNQGFDIRRLTDFFVS